MDIVLEMYVNNMGRKNVDNINLLILSGKWIY